jgi:hypothetical protein
LSEFYQDELDRQACKVVSEAYTRDEQWWKEDHEHQELLWKIVMGKPLDGKEVIPGRSDIQTGVPYMIKQVIYVMLKSVLLDVSENIKLDPTTHRKIILAVEELQQDLDNMIADDQSIIKRNLSRGLDDLIVTGNCVQRPYFEHMTRIAHDGENDIEVLAYDGAAFKPFPSWDVFPAAGATSTDDELHHVIFLERLFPHELREWERQGFIENVDEFLKGSDSTPPDPGADNTHDPKNPREPVKDENLDSSGRYPILIYWGKFPLYQSEEYIGLDGKDRSKDEVECVIIKPLKRDIILAKYRNPHYHQQKAAIFGKYFDVPGVFWSESVFGVLYKMLIHQKDLFNLIQDGANAEIYPDLIMPTNIDEAQAKQTGAGKKYDVEPDDLAEGKIPQYIARPNSILPTLYEQRTYVDRQIQEVSGIIDMLRGVADSQNKTATEIEELSKSISQRFEQTAIDIQNTYMIPVAQWIMALMSQYSDDKVVMERTGLPFNPYKQFDAMIPNDGYRISMEGSKKAVRNIMLQKALHNFIEQAKTIPPMPDENGNIVQANVLRMFFDAMKMSGLKDTEKYKMAPMPIMQNEGVPANAE